MKITTKVIGRLESRPPEVCLLQAELYYVHTHTILAPKTHIPPNLKLMLSVPDCLAALKKSKAVSQNLESTPWAIQAPNMECERVTCVYLDEV